MLLTDKGIKKIYYLFYIDNNINEVNTLYIQKSNHNNCAKLQKLMATHISSFTMLSRENLGSLRFDVDEG